MDARERLRLYLEQRRELGESELVLDGMPVDDVMALLGARATARPTRQVKGPVSAMVPPATSVPPTRAADSVEPRVARDEPASVAPPSAAPPPEPEVRFDSSASADWRETLRQANAQAPGVSGSKKDAAPQLDRVNTRVASLPTWISELGLPAGVAAGVGTIHDIASGAYASTDSLDALATHIRACTRCALHEGARHAVPGEGHPRAEFLCVGEAPGANEDEQGRPFVGEAGQLLTKILSAISLSRDDVYICNVLKHRPPANRDPLPDEVLACQPFLQRQVELVQPRVILALGRFAAQTLLETSTALSKLRGHVHQYRGIPVVVTYHPAALLRNEAWKRPTWEDVKFARRILDASRAAPDGARGA